MITEAKQINLALAFLLEIGVLGALGIWGLQTGSGTLAHIAFGIGAPLIAVGVWAVFGAPRSTQRLHGPGLLALRIVFFGSGAVALWVADHHSSYPFRDSLGGQHNTDLCVGTIGEGLSQFIKWPARLTLNASNKRWVRRAFWIHVLHITLRVKPNTQIHVFIKQDKV